MNWNKLFVALGGIILASALQCESPALAGSGAERVVRIDVGRQLFVDDFLIEDTNLTRTFHPARLSDKNPVLWPETPLEMNHDRIPVAAPFDDGAWYDEQEKLFKLWYHGGWFDGNCLAVSKDGLTWRRPALDAAPGTNRVLPVRRNARGEQLMRDGTTVWLDRQTTNPAERYKMFVYSRRLLPTEHGELFTSPDGIHWSPPLALTFKHGDNSSFFYDPFRKVWVFSIRYMGKSWQNHSVRARAYLAKDDFKEFARATDNEIVPWLIADAGDKADPALGHEPQLYDFTAAAYESLMVGVYGIFYGPPNEIATKEKRPKIIDLELGFSRDGFHYNRPTRAPFLACSRAPGAWNRGYLHPATGVCLVVGDELWFYFGTWSGLSPKEGGDIYAGGNTGLAVLRRDGFASLDAGAEPGVVTTKPVVFSGKYPFVNAAVKGGELRMEVLDVAGKVIAPYSRENCLPLKGDATCQRIQWKGAPDLEALAGKPVRFRFTVRQGKLYAFWVSPGENGASHGYVAAGGPGFSGPTDTVGNGKE